MKQYALLAFLSPVASLLAVTGPAQSEKLKTKTNPQKQPNVIFIYADDLGYGDLECYGAKNVQTPHVNQLAESGVQFTNAHANMPPYKRPVNTVFQKYALFPHLNVFENVAFGLRLKKMTEDEIRPKVLEMLEIVGLKGFERRSIYQLSGGQQQRVAIARSLVNQRSEEHTSELQSHA